MNNVYLPPEEDNTPGKNKTNSKSNKTNKTAKKKKGALTDIEETILSNPDSSGERLSSLKVILLERNTCTIRKVINPLSRERIIIITTSKYQQSK
jgi:hypothetical protein